MFIKEGKLDGEGDLIGKVQATDAHTSIAQVALDVADEEKRGKEAVRLLNDGDAAKETGLALVMPHTLEPAHNHEHHLVIYSQKSAYVEKSGKTVRRFWARCVLCRGKDSWATVDPVWAEQNPHQMKSLKALDLDPAVAHIRELARTGAAEEEED